MAQRAFKRSKANQIRQRLNQKGKEKFAVEKYMKRGVQKLSDYGIDTNSAAIHDDVKKFEAELAKLSQEIESGTHPDGYIRNMVLNIMDLFETLDLSSIDDSILLDIDERLEITYEDQGGVFSSLSSETVKNTKSAPKKGKKGVDRKELRHTMSWVQGEFKRIEKNMSSGSKQRLDYILKRLSRVGSQNTELAKDFMKITKDWSKKDAGTRVKGLDKFLKNNFIGPRPFVDGLKKISDYGINTKTKNKKLREIIDEVNQFRFDRRDFFKREGIENLDELGDLDRDKAAIYFENRLLDVIETLENAQQEIDDYDKNPANYDAKELTELSKYTVEIEQIKDALTKEQESLKKNKGFRSRKFRDSSTLQDSKGIKKDDGTAELDWNDYIKESKGQKADTRAILKDNISDTVIFDLMAQEIKAGNLVIINDNHLSVQDRNQRFIKELTKRAADGILIAEAPSEIGPDASEDEIRKWEEIKSHGTATNITPYAKEAIQGGWKVMPVDATNPEKKDFIFEEVKNEDIKVWMDGHYDNKGNIRYDDSLKTTKAKREEKAQIIKRHIKNKPAEDTASVLRQEWIGAQTVDRFLSQDAGGLMIIGTAHIDGAPEKGFRHLKWMLTGLDDNNLETREKIFKKGNLTFQVIKREDIEDNKKMSAAILQSLKDLKGIKTK